MNKPEINYDEIDESIVDLIYKLNQIPFSETLGSCEGHIRDYMGTSTVKPDEGAVFLWPGQISFNIDAEHNQTSQFLEELEALKETYSFVDLIDHRCGYKNCNVEGSKILRLGIEDLSNSLDQTPSDNLTESFKKNYQVNKVVAEDRIGGYQQVWQKLSQIADQYIIPDIMPGNT